MKTNPSSSSRLAVQDYTRAAEPLLRFLNGLHAEGAPPEPPDIPDDGALPDGYTYPTRATALPVSDVVDGLGRRCVDLVQEGGGVHGIALAGYTYVLEKMGLTFVKTAGTSAGAINAMLLNAVVTRDELKKLQSTPSAVSSAHYNPAALDPEKYYGTRSEKLLEYLAGKDLGDLVDGHPMWRELLRDTFKGRVKLDNIKAEAKRWLAWGIMGIVGLLVIVGTVLAVVFGHSGTGWKIAGGAGLLLLLLAAGLLATRAWKGRVLWTVAEKLGANPGQNFEDWVAGLLRENSVGNITALWNKLARETECFSPGYRPIPAPKEKDFRKRPQDNLAQNREAQFFRLLERLEDRVTKLEGTPSSDDLQGIAGESTKAEIIEEVWEKLLDIARDLPWGYEDEDDDDRAEALAWQAARMAPLFQRVLALQEESCGYTDYRKKGPYTNEITLVAADITNEMKVEFPAMHRMYWGNDFSISPATYVRASMAVPFFFKPLRVTHKRENEKQMQDMEAAWHHYMRVRRRISHAETVFVDGGLLSNFPVNIYHSPDMPLSRKPTFGVRLEFENESLTNQVNDVLGEAGTLVSTMRYFYDRDFLSKNDLYKLTVRSIDTGQVHWLNFSLTEEEKMELFFRGALAAAFFLAAGHPEYRKHKAVLDEKLKAYGERVWCGGARPRMNIHAGTKGYGHEDYGDSSVVFDWSAYKRERIMALARGKQQRRWLKSFPNEQQ